MANDKTKNAILFLSTRWIDLIGYRIISDHETNMLAEITICLKCVNKYE
jgi:hypothetical protein